MSLRITGHVYLFQHEQAAPVPLLQVPALQHAGEVFDFRCLENLVVNVGLDALAALIGGGFGTPSVGGDTYSPGTVCRGDQSPPVGVFVERLDLGLVTAPPAPTATDSGLFGPTAYSARIRDSELAVSYPLTGTVAFTTLVPAGTLDGEDFTEEGLFLASGKLFSRRVISPAYHKLIGKQLQVIHTLRIERA